jgi:glycosyltransferase involved in cell wall biosynthesis
MDSVTYVLTKYVQPTQTFVTGEIAELRRQGVAVEVIAMEAGEQRPANGDDARILSQEHPQLAQLIREHGSALVRRPRRYLAFLVEVIRLRSEMGRLPEQVPWTLLPGVARGVRGRALHAHFAWSGAAAASLLSILTGLPWSMTLHANDIFNRQRNLSRKLATADRLITVCDYNLDWMRRHLGLTRDVSLVICGVEPPREPWPRVGAADVVAVARLVEKKGLDVLVRATALLRGAHPGLRVDILGSGRCQGHLEALIEQLGVGDNVRLLGARPHEETLARIAGAKVFCLPARIAEDGDRDSMPVVIKEAMARRVPVVASAIVAIPEMLADGCGWMVPPDDVEALATTLEEVLADPAKRAEVAAAAHARVLQRFTLEGETRRLRNLLLG